MRAQNLSVCVPYNGCDKECPYCVSRMTGYMKSNVDLIAGNMEKVKTLARTTGITSVSLTSKGEPCLNPKSLFVLIDCFKEWPIELQTNGIQLLANLLKGSGKYVTDLKFKGLNVLAISIDKWGIFDQMKPLIKVARETGLVVRATIPVTKFLNDELTLRDYVEKAKECGLHQLSFRQVTVPPNPIDTDGSKKTHEWIKENVSTAQYYNLYDSMPINKALLKLPYGSSIVDIDGIAVAAFEYCLQDSSNGEDIRSLIFQEDGHLYLTWNSEASILF